MEPTPEPETGELPTGFQVHQRVEAYLDEWAAAAAPGAVPDWLVQPVAHVATVLRRLGGWPLSLLRRAGVTAD